MSIEETTQLIQLILNSVLMVLACAFVLAGLLVRRSVQENRLQITSIEYVQLLNRFEEQSDRVLMLKKQLRFLQQRLKSSHNSILVMYYALALFVASTFALAVRSVTPANWLITAAMALFVAGMAIVLLSVAIVLLDLHQSESAQNRSFWQEFPQRSLSSKIAKRRSLKLRGVARAPRRVKIV